MRYHSSEARISTARSSDRPASTGSAPAHRLILPSRFGPSPYISESARSKRHHEARGAACREAAQGAAPHRPTQSLCAAPNSPRRSNSPRPPTPAAAGAIRRRGAPLRRHRLRAGRAGTRLERAPRLPGVHLRMRACDHCDHIGPGPSHSLHESVLAHDASAGPNICRPHLHSAPFS